MKKLSFLNKLVYITNSFFAILLLIGFCISYISPERLPKMAVLSLGVPILIVINICFVLYWLVGLKKQFLLSGLILLLGIFISSPFYKLSKKMITSEDEISIMNYNVRLFNSYNWIDDKEIPKKISSFVKEQAPDILCIQEFHPLGDSLFNYPYKYIKTKTEKKKFGQAIFSKYKIVGQGSLDFNSRQNNTIFVDIVKDLDTLRVYNMHLESLGLDLKEENFGEQNSEKLIARLSKEFLKQTVQVKLIAEHKKTCDYPMILSGDLNNSAYSWVYRTLKGNMHDSFLEAGSGFGKTYEVKKLPMRIDFIFADKILQINEHKNFNVKYSDHFPIMAKIGLD